MDTLNTIVIVGECNGTYVNEAVTKEFSGKLLVTARPDGAIIVHNLGAGVRPVCYIDGGAEFSLARNTDEADIEMFATTEDGQQLTLQFTDIMAIHGVPEPQKQSSSIATSILKCVFDLGGKYGRTTIARVLTGSVSKKVLTIEISRLGTYGVARDSPMKEVLGLIDWLIEENYIAYVEDSEFPILVITSKGLDILAGGDELPVEGTTAPKKKPNMWCAACGSPDWRYTMGDDGPEECWCKKCGADLTEQGAITTEKPKPDSSANDQEGPT